MNGEQKREEAKRPSSIMLNASEQARERLRRFADTDRRAMIDTLDLILEQEEERRGHKQSDTESDGGDPNVG